jgi:predicted negative regulator of RcsB-dependent stress response
MTWLKVVDHYVRQFRYARQAAVACLLVLLLFAAMFLYRWYEDYRTEQAHGVLAHAIELFERAEQENTKVLWEETDRAFSQGYSSYSGTSLAPYFLAFQSEIAVRQDERVKARELMDKAVHVMARTAKLYGPYAVKLALMQIDSGEPALVEKGTSSLHALAHDSKNPDRDMALYYEGLRLFEQGDRSAAEKIWHTLVGDVHGADSIWAQIAQAKLDYTA